MTAINYSKWDHIELSDDEDIECHPNVDKKSLIRWKQQDIHRKREERRAKIGNLSAETGTNVVLLERLERLLNEMPSAFTSSPPTASGLPESPIAFISRLSDQLKVAGQRPEAPRYAPDAPTYDNMVAALLLQIVSEVSKDTNTGEGADKLAAEEDDPSCHARQWEAVLSKLAEHKGKLALRQEQALDELHKLRKEDESKLSVDDLCKPGFDRTILNKTKQPPPEPEPPRKVKGKQKTIEVLNPGTADEHKAGISSTAAADGNDDSDDDEDIVTSEVAKEFSKLRSLEESFAFISNHTYIVSEKKSDEILAAAFEAQMRGKEKTARRCVQQALVLKYCSQLGKDGVSLFFKRMANPGKALDMFSKDVRDTYSHIQKRCKILKEEKAAKAADGRETIQLFTPDPSKPINFQLPTAETNAAGLAIFNEFPQEFREALLTKELDKVNKVLGKMDCAKAEALVEKLGEAGILTIEPEIRDAEEMKKLEENVRTEREMAAVDDALPPPLPAA